MLLTGYKYLENHVLTVAQPLSLDEQFEDTRQLLLETLALFEVIELRRVIQAAPPCHELGGGMRYQLTASSEIDNREQ